MATFVVLQSNALDNNNNIDTETVDHIDTQYIGALNPMWRVVKGKHDWNVGAVGDVSPGRRKNNKIQGAPHVTKQHPRSMLVHVPGKHDYNVLPASAL